MSGLQIFTAHSCNPDPEAAVAEIRRQIDDPAALAVLILFCSPAYDPRLLAAELQRHFPSPLLACTTAGELSPAGYGQGGIVATGLASSRLKVHLHLIHPLSRPDPRPTPDLSARVKKVDPAHSFAMLLIDGLAMQEERIAAMLSALLGGIPLFGGSAGDGLDFRQTRVYYQGKFLSNAAVLALFETDLPFRIFRVQHFRPGEKRLVITEADAVHRVVSEINGRPAAAEYARAVGVSAAELSPAVFAAHPLMLRVGGSYYVRSIQQVNPDGSLTFYCAIDSGLVLRIGRGDDLLANLRHNLEELKEELPGLKLIVGCDCILRRLELQERGELEAADKILAPYNFIGFSTYGEQINGVHVNQTLTGLALGE